MPAWQEAAPRPRAMDTPCLGAQTGGASASTNQPQPWAQNPGERLGELVTRTRLAVGPAAPTQDGQSLLQAGEHPCSPSETCFGGLFSMATSPWESDCRVGDTPWPLGHPVPLL